MSNTAPLYRQMYRALCYPFNRTAVKGQKACAENGAKGRMYHI